jgi:hypothetical protein
VFHVRRISQATSPLTRRLERSCAIWTRMRKEIIRCCVSGTNVWVCVPGDQNIIDWTDKCIDPMGMVWLKDLLARKPKLTNSSPGLTYMLPPLGPSVRLLRPMRADRCGIFFAIERERTS